MKECRAVILCGGLQRNGDFITPEALAQVAAGMLQGNKKLEYDVEKQTISVVMPAPKELTDKV